MTEQQTFNYIAKTGKHPTKPKEKTTHGYLEYLGVKVAGPLPYPLLQSKRTELIKSGHSRKHLKITSK